MMNRDWFMVFNVTCNNISVISWQSVLLMEEAGVPNENHWPSTSHWQTLSHNVVLMMNRDSNENKMKVHKPFNLKSNWIYMFDLIGRHHSNKLKIIKWNCFLNIWRKHTFCVSIVKKIETLQYSNALCKKSMQCFVLKLCYDVSNWKRFFKNVNTFKEIHSFNCCKMSCKSLSKTT
jgi:hypothetical protein